MLSSSLKLLLPLLLAGSLLAQGERSSRVVLRAPWGKSAGAFGMERDGARLGPSALAVARGQVFVLDRINARVQVFSLAGELVRVIPTASKSVGMLALEGGGKVLVMDAFVRREVRILGSGGVERILPLPAQKKELPTALFAGHDRILIEWDHAQLSALLCPGIRPLFPSPRIGQVGYGRPTSWGWVSASRQGAGISLKFGKADKLQPRSILLPVEKGVECILALGGDSRGRVLVGYYSWHDPARRLQVAMLSSTGKVLASFSMVDGSITDLYTRLYLSPAGRLYQLATGTNGVTIREWLWEGKGAQK